MENLRCPIDKDIFEDPVTLNCGHSICLSCATILIKNNTIECPLDRKKHSLPLGRDSLSINYTLKTVIESLNLNSSNDPSNLQSVKEGILNSFVNSTISLEITKITPISNNSLKKRFEAAKSRFPSKSKTLTKYHGTCLSAASKIKNEGFKIPTSFTRESNCEGALNFGKAIYLSTYSSKAASYCPSSPMVLIVCEVILGRVSIQTNSIFDMTPEKMRGLGFDSIYCSHDLKGSEVNKGGENDEYAIYDPDLILPLYLVEFQEKNVFASKEFLEYKQPISPKDVNFDALFKILKNGTFIQKKNILLSLGDLGRDFNAETTKNIIKYYQYFFPTIAQLLSSNNEVMILAAGRVLWNISYNNKNLQKIILEQIKPEIFFNLLVDFSSLENVKERITGVLANLTQLEEVNSIQIAKQKKFSVLFEIAIVCHQKRNFKTCANAIIVIANVFEFDQTWSQKLADLDDLLDSKDEVVRNHATRIFSNKIGYSKEWLIQGYKPTVGLNKI